MPDCWITNGMSHWGDKLRSEGVFECRTPFSASRTGGRDLQDDECVRNMAGSQKVRGCRGYVVAGELVSIMVLWGVV